MHALRIPLMSVLALAVMVALSSPDPAAAASGYNECQFSKRKAKRKKAPLCRKDIHKSTWIMVSGIWREKLTVTEQSDSASFQGEGETNFRAGGLSGRSPFPSKKRPVVTMLSKPMYDHLIEFGMTSTGGWTTDQGRHYPCGLTFGEQHKPLGWGGIFMLAGDNVRVQWPVGAAGFGCGSAPYLAPEIDFPTPVATYKLDSFRNRRLVVLPIAFAHDSKTDEMTARRTIDGVGRMRRYR